MKITEYSAVTSLNEDNVFILDGSAGTKTIKAGDLLFALTDIFGPEMHRMIYRGKNLGNSFTSTQRTNVQNGTFKDLWLGDYWTINGVNWRIVDFDYWYGTGDTKTTAHHLVIMPDEALYTASMNDTSVTTGGYVGSKMYTTNLTNAKGTISSAFGTNILEHREYLINTVGTGGAPSAGAYLDSTVELPNELMIYGCYIFTLNATGDASAKRYTNSKMQLALMSVKPEFANVSMWLRDVTSTSQFACVDARGGAHSAGAANTYGVRPVFAIG